MAFATMQFRAERLGKQADLCAIVPEAPGPWPVLYLLHGLSDGYGAWTRLTSLERYAGGRGLLVVMPDGHRSFYTNDPRPDGHAYEDHIVIDVMDFVERTFPVRAERAGRAVAGLSMGGYGALMLALRHPDRFAAASGHSSALWFVHQRSDDRPGIQALADALPAGAYDCFCLAERLADSGGPRPALRFDCGTDDRLLEANRAFDKHLTNLGIAHEYDEFPGTHGWDYWDTHVPQTLDFVLQHLAGGTG